MNLSYQRTISLPGNTTIEIAIHQGDVFQLDPSARSIMFGILDLVREYAEHCKTQPCGTGGKPA